MRSTVTRQLLRKESPSNSIVLFPIRTGKWCDKRARDLTRATGQGVVSDSHLNFCAISHKKLTVFVEVFPAVIAVFGFAVGDGDAGFGGGAAAFAGQAYSYQAFAVGENDAALDVVPGVALVAFHDRELHAVDEQQFVEREAQGLGDQHVNFDQGHAAGVIAAQSAVAGPVAGEISPECLRQARVVGLAPALFGEGQVEDLFPQGGVVGS